MTYEFIKVSRSDAIGVIALSRPDKRNAMHGPMITELLRAIKILADDDSRLLLIHGEGEHFCAGGDIAWMQQIALGSDDQNYDDAQALADLLYAIYTFPKPSLVMAHGMTLGGGMGLLAAADIAIASRNAAFGLPEVKIGLTPSMISPYVIAAIGVRASHYYFLTGERFGVEEAFRLGLIHQLSETDALMSTGMSIAQTLLMNSPQALRNAKQLIRRVSQEKISAELAQKTAEHLAELRATPEAQEGLHAFLEKRSPRWQ